MAEEVVEEKVVEEQETVTEPVEETEEVEETWLSENAVTSILSEAKLPEKAKTRLAEKQYSDEGMLKAAVQKEADYIKEITGAGSPVIVAGKPVTEQKTVTLAERNAAKSAVNKMWLGTRVRQEK